MKSQSPTTKFFDSISGYWAEIADARPTGEQVNFVKAKISDMGLVLDLGCGNGRHAIPLSKAGYNLVGLDVSPHLLQAAKQKAAETGTNVALVRADMNCLPFRDRTFTAIISLDTSFGYFPQQNCAIQTLTEAARTLTGNGVLILDVFNREYMLERYSKKIIANVQPLLFRALMRFPFLEGLFKWWEYPSFYLLQHRSVTENGGKLVDTWVFRDKKTGKITLAQHVVWLYSFSGLEALLLKAGFRVEEGWGSYEGAAYGFDSKRLIVISRYG